MDVSQTNNPASENTLMMSQRKAPSNMSETSQRLELCSASDIPDGSAIKVEKSGLVLAVFNVDGEIYVTDDACTHGPGSLSDGYIEGDVVECDFHNGAFNIKTGEVVKPPCFVPLRTYVTSVEDGKVYIDTE